MSKHETALALLDNELERLNKERAEAEGKRMLAKGSLERAEKEVKLLDWSIEQVEASKSSLIFDRQAAKEPVDL